MSFMRDLAVSLYYIMIGIVVVQFFALFIRNVGFLPLWILIEYMQLVAFMPLYNFKLIPYLYDAFKPFLISHLILFDDSILYQEMSDDYFNINYEYYWLPVSKLLQSLMNILILLILVVIANLVIYLMSTACKSARYLLQKFNPRLALESSWSAECHSSSTTCTCVSLCSFTSISHSSPS